MSDTVTRFMELYRGLPDAFGTGRGQWVHRPPQRADFEEHLRGEGPGLGIAPLRRDGTVLWAAIDLDEPNFDVARDMQELLGFGSTWIERSRSGNAHVLAFFAEPIEAWVVRGILREVTATVGKPTAEVFPKIDKLRDDDSLGNYLNLCYHGDARPVLGGDRLQPLRLEDFLTLACSTLNAPDAWRARARWYQIVPPEERNRERQEFGSGKELHMCAEWIIANRDENPILEGHRNTVYFNLSKMLLHYEGFDDDEAWELVSLVEQSAQEQGVDRVTEYELRRIFNNAKRGGFTSTGCDDSLMSPYVHPDCPIAQGR